MNPDEPLTLTILGRRVPQNGLMQRREASRASGPVCPPAQGLGIAVDRGGGGNRPERPVGKWKAGQKSTGREARIARKQPRRGEIVEAAGTTGHIARIP